MRKQTPPTASFVRQILDYNPKTGVFRWRQRKDRSKQWNTRWVGKIAGYPIKGHIRIQIDGKPGFYAHCLAWLVMTGKWPENQIDHKNYQRADNRFRNLREATNSQNMHNRLGPQKNGSSGFLGVHHCGNRWRARVTVEGVDHTLGYFDTPEEAAKARDKGAKQLHQEFASLNRHTGKAP